MNSVVVRWIVLMCASPVMAFAQMEILSVQDVAVMQQDANGNFSIVCSNGNRETATPLDLELGNVCPNRRSSTPSFILSLQKREDGKFDVVCKDMTRTVADAAQIMAGNVCKPPTPPTPVIQNGLYAPVSGYTSFCKQVVEAEFSGKDLIGMGLRLQPPCGNYVIQLKCRGVECSGDWQGRRYSTKVLASDSYQFDGESQTAVFKRTNN